MRPPPGPAPVQTAITGTRNTKAETNRALVGRIKRAGTAAGVELEPWQIRSLKATLIAQRQEPTDEQVLRALMAAPWFPKPRVRRHGIGGPGWRVTS